MKPIRCDKEKDVIYSKCVDYMRLWFGIPAPEWEIRSVDGAEKVDLLKEKDSNQLKIPFDGESENTLIEYTAIDLANFVLATTLMNNKLQGKPNLSAKYIAAIGFRSAVKATQESTKTSIQRVA